MPDAVVGRRLDDVPTPALVLDLDQLDANIRSAADWARGHVQLRPHIKNPKSVDIARRQIAAGAIGVTAATVVEAKAMLDAGMPEVLIANQVVNTGKLDALLAGLDSGDRIIIAVDSNAGVEALAAAGLRAGVVPGALIEVDVGMGRGGTRGIPETVALAATIASTEGVRFRGVMGYEGHTVLEKDDDLRASNAVAAAGLLMQHVQALRDAGHEVPIVSAGGTNTHRTTGLLDGVTELQMGTYVTMDTAYESYVPGLVCAVSIVAQVVSVHGDTVILDAGGKTFGGGALGFPRSRTAGLTVRTLNDEHMIARITGDAPAIGSVHRFDVASVGPAVLANWRYLVVQGDTIVDVWPIAGRQGDAAATTVANGGAA